MHRTHSIQADTSRQVVHKLLNDVSGVHYPTWFAAVFAVACSSFLSGSESAEWWCVVSETRLTWAAELVTFKSCSVTFFFSAPSLTLGLVLSYTRYNFYAHPLYLCAICVCFCLMKIFFFFHLSCKCDLLPFVRNDEHTRPQCLLFRS